MRISLVPDGVYESYRQITPELLQSKGICLLLSDLDFTLAPKSTPRPDAAVHTGQVPAPTPCSMRSSGCGGRAGPRAR